jgi:hypothetical protein
MAASSSAEDGVATTDSSINKSCMATFVASCTAEALSLVDCCLMDHLWGYNFSTKTLCYYYSNLKLFSSLRFALNWGGMVELERNGPSMAGLVAFSVI